MSLVDSIAGWIRGEVERAGANGVVVGLSGGIDSATVAALSARALGPDRVLGALLPVASRPEDLAHAELAAHTFGVHVSLEAIERGDTATLRTEQGARVQQMIAGQEHKRHTPPVFGARESLSVPEHR